MPGKQYYTNRDKLLAEQEKKRNPDNSSESENLLKKIGILTLILLTGGYLLRSSNLPKECDDFTEVGENDWRTSKNIELYTGDNTPLWSDAECAAMLFVKSHYHDRVDLQSNIPIHRGDDHSATGLRDAFCNTVFHNRDKITPPRNGTELNIRHNPAVLYGVQTVQNGNQQNIHTYHFGGPKIAIGKGNPQRHPETKGAAMLRRNSGR